METANNSFEKILKAIIVFGCTLVVIVPLVLVPSSYFPYIIQKTIILRILIEFIFGAYIVLALFRPEYRPKKSLLLWSVLAFAVVMLLSTFLGQSFVRSWWGSWERMFGTFNYLHYFAWFIVVISVFNKKKHWNRILNATLIVSLLISLYAISQRLGLSFTFEAGLQRVNGTIGNASYLATYMLFHLFIAMIFFIERAGIKWKLFYFLIFIIDLLVLILTGTRGAILALMFSVVILVVLILWLKMWKSKAFKIILAFCIIFFIGIGILYAFKNTGFVQGNYWFKRFTNYSLQDNTIKTRFLAWEWGMKGFKDNLLLGVGPENFQNVFNQYFEGEFYNYSRNEVWFDRAHNTLVDMASMIGIFGLLAYLSIFGVVFYFLLDLKRRGKLSPPIFLIFFLLFFSYFFQNIFVFDSLNSLILFYLLLGFLYFIY